MKPSDHYLQVQEKTRLEMEQGYTKLLQVHEAAIRKLAAAGITGLGLLDSVDLLIERIRKSRRILLEANSTRLHAETALQDQKFLNDELLGEREKFVFTLVNIIGVLDGFETASDMENVYAAFTALKELLEEVK